MKQRYIFILVIAIILVVALVWGIRSSKGPEELPVATTTPTSTQGKMSWQTYEGDGWAIEYLGGFSVNPAYQYEALGPGKAIKGVSFTVPAYMAEGTNLSADSKISVEQMSTSSCKASAFLSSPVSEQAVVIDGVSWDMGLGSDAGAGNLYEEKVYARTEQETCYGIRLFTHTTRIENYDPGTVTEFDKTALENIYLDMIKSFRFSE